MPTNKMHADEVHTDATLVHNLLQAQFPQWAALPIQPVPSAGTDNALYRLGDDLVVRMPRIHGATGQAAKELRWLPDLAPHLPLSIPKPVAMGDPGEGFPWRWSIYQWLEGENATLPRITDMRQMALDLAHFVAALHAIDATHGPQPGAHNSGRGEPLAMRDAPTRKAIAALAGTIDVDATTAVWESALSAPPWIDRPVWIHGDLQSGNLLAINGRLSAVIDFGCLGVGDPACDVMAAWLTLTKDSRDRFRRTLSVDDATWTRARGWALSVGLIALPYYRITNPTLAAIARRSIDETVADSQE